MQIEHITNQPVIESERFILRPLRKSDAGLISLFASDERVARATRSVPHPLPPGSTEALISRSNSDDRIEDVWVIDGVQSGLSEVLGLIALKHMDRNQSEISYWVAPVFWNTGIASAAVQALVAANPHGSETIVGSVFQDNPASARVLTNAGFEYIGDAEEFSIARDSRVATWTYILKLG